MFHISVNNLNDDEALFVPRVPRTAGNGENICLDYASLIHFKTMFSFDPAIPIVQYDVDSSRSPITTLLVAKGNESKGTALLKSKDVYYSVAPKLPTDTKTNSSQTKSENNVFLYRG
jgi:hypothetical protein